MKWVKFIGLLIMFLGSMILFMGFQSDLLNYYSDVETDLKPIINREVNVTFILWVGLTTSLVTLLYSLRELLRK